MLISVMFNYYSPSLGYWWIPVRRTVIDFNIEGAVYHHVIMKRLDNLLVDIVATPFCTA